MKRLHLFSLVVCSLFLFTSVVFAITPGGNTATGTYSSGAHKKYEQSYSVSPTTNAEIYSYGSASAYQYNYANSGTFTIGGYYCDGYDGGPGYYVKQHGANAGEIKLFNKHPQPQAKNEWLFLGTNYIPPVTISRVASQYGYTNAEVNGFSFTKAFETSDSAFSVAFSRVGASAIAFGGATGVGGGKEIAESQTVVYGRVGQANNAGKNLGTAQIRGGNESWAGFVETDSNYKTGHGLAISCSAVSAGAMVGGFTYVKAIEDPTNPSVFGVTGNFAKTTGNPDYSIVGGSGSLNGSVVSAGGGNAGANVTFSYGAGTFGWGAASMKASVVETPNGMTATSSGWSKAGGVGAQPPSMP